MKTIRADRYTDSIFRVWLEDRAFVTWGDWLYLRDMVQDDRAEIENIKSVKLYNAYLGTLMVAVGGEEA